MDGVVKSRGQLSYEMRVSTRISWSEIAIELGYSSHKGASVAARSYARRVGFPWPIRGITKGESIYRGKQRCAYKYAKRNEKEWPPC